jgi:hypothetical protein
MSKEKTSKEADNSALRKTNVMPCFSSLWNETSKSLPNVNKSCLAIRQNTKLCNLYYDGSNWMDDGYDSKSERVFTDVTHWILLSDIPLPK